MKYGQDHIKNTAIIAQWILDNKSFDDITMLLDELVHNGYDLEGAWEDILTNP
tara:strand:- start:546 stop:704 length:159 start_codon:yes stop_codon:yes gene_type:complete